MRPLGQTVLREAASSAASSRSCALALAAVMGFCKGPNAFSCCSHTLRSELHDAAGIRNRSNACSSPCSNGLDAAAVLSSRSLLEVHVGKNGHGYHK